MAEPRGVVLAGGRGRRMGGRKPAATFRGRPLMAGPVEAMQAAGLQVAVVAKTRTELPHLPGVQLLHEPDEPHHPLVGVACALRELSCPIVVCAADMPFVPPALFRELALEGASPLTIVATAEHDQPLLGLYKAELLPMIDYAILGEWSLRRFVAELGEGVARITGTRLERFGDPTHITSDLDTPNQLQTAESRDPHLTDRLQTPLTQSPDGPKRCVVD